MKRMNYAHFFTTIISCVISLSLFLSCSTSVHLPVPGESATVNRSLSIEYMTIADAYNDLGKYDKACEYYMLAMKNKNLYWSAYYKLGRCYAMSKKWTEARKVYQKILKRDKDNLNIQISLAYIYAMEGRLEASENIYEYLVRENPDNPDTLVNYIDVLFASEKYDDAEKKLAELKEKFSDNKNIEAFDKKLAEVRPPEVDVDAEDAEDIVSEEGEFEETDEEIL